MSLETAVSKARLIMRDYGEPLQARVIGDGESSRYDLPATNISTEGLAVYIQAGDPPVMTTLTPSLDATPGPTEYHLEERAGVITLGMPLAQGAVLVVTGTSMLFSTASDMGDFIDIAFGLHAKGRSPALTWDNITPTEEYVLALYAVREALWAEIAEAAHQVDVTTPEGMHIPGGQHFQQLMAMLERLEAHYRELATALNIGPFRIEMFTLRRVSRTTNRLVPVYVPQEIDDRSTPVRVYPPIDPGF